MDPSENPFCPGAGSPPPELSGRQEILQQASISSKRLKKGRSVKSSLLVGLRGVGKTVLLQRICDTFCEEGYEPISIEAHEGQSLVLQLVASLKSLLFKLNSRGASGTATRALRVLQSFVKGARVSYGGLDIQLDIGPEVGSADSGDVEIDLPKLIEAVGDALKAQKSSVVFIIDELQYASKKELSALIMSLHRAVQRQLPMTLIGAGLPQLVGLTGRSKSYAERLFDFTEIGPLNKEDAFQALQGPAKALGAQFSREALEEILLMTKGYSYFLQEWGYHSWNLSESPNIHLSIAQKATGLALQCLDSGFFRVRFDRLTPKEKEYLRALADLGPGAQRSGSVADSLGSGPQSVAPVRNNLIKKGMIYSRAHGEIEFTVPLFDDFMKRAMP